jgi:hypothetical protein
LSRVSSFFIWFPHPVYFYIFHVTLRDICFSFLSRIFNEKGPCESFVNFCFLFGHFSCFFFLTFYFVLWNNKMGEW